MPGDSIKGKGFILGAGISGLGAALSSGLPVFEANSVPGGICASYHVRPPKPGEQTPERMFYAPEDGESYRFEIGGGHWLWGKDSLALKLISSLTPMKSYSRKAAVYFPDRDTFVPYPLQNNLRHLGREISEKVLVEVTRNASGKHHPRTMADWLEVNFGTTLSYLFFHPFHELYTAGLWKTIAPQDPSKSPVDIGQVVRGALGDSGHSGYNVNFMYPSEGLNTLVRRIADRCVVHTSCRAVCIEPPQKAVYFGDGSVRSYSCLLSSIPLNKMLEITGISVDEELDPYTSVLVVNIGAHKGPRCPEEHWLYVPRSRAGFHRVGFYSNVDPVFLPYSSRQRSDRVAIYVEKAYRGGEKPSDDCIGKVKQQIVEELRSWGWLGDLEVCDATWVDVAYTWSLPGSRWRVRAISALAEHDVYQVGRYASWATELTAQGIVESLKSGLTAGAVLGLRI